MEKIKKYLQINQQILSLYVLLLFSFFIYSYYAFTYDLVWWDEAVYIGMGKYLATMGHIGFWEYFRPVVFPIFYALVYILHLPLVFFGKISVVSSTVGLIYLAYKEAEASKAGSGLWAGLFVFFTPVIFYFSKIALSDIISAFLATLALHFFIKRKDFLSGLIVGVAFLTRFPQGLILVAIMVSLLYREYDRINFHYFKRVFFAGLKIFAGFALLVFPYLISNYFLYGDALKPIHDASQIILLYNFIYFKGLWYYLFELWFSAPFLFLSIFSLVLVFNQFKKDSVKNIPLVSVFITSVIFCVYFFIQPHKELRYSIAFIPYLAILAGVGISWTLDKVALRYVLRAVYILGLILFVSQAIHYLKYQEVDPHKDLYDFFADKTGKYLSTTPVPAAVSNILIVENIESYNALRDFDTILGNRMNEIDGIIISTSDIFCEAKATGGNCDKEIEVLYNKLKVNFKQVYSKDVGIYNDSVFEKIK
jgi:4-amino-4-deoxy-L-arabinose transferase-like glycosyltransferase